MKIDHHADRLGPADRGHYSGPHGPASVVFTPIALESFIEAACPCDTLFAIATWTIFQGALLHGTRSASKPLLQTCRS